MVICDVSGRNPNVLYELGVRQAFDRPVTLLKDGQTEWIFDVQMLRHVEYDSSLRIDLVNDAQDQLAEAIRETASTRPEDVNSLISILKIAAASVQPVGEMPEQEAVLLRTVLDLARRMSMIESGISKREGLR